VELIIRTIKLQTQCKFSYHSYKTTPFPFISLVNGPGFVFDLFLILLSPFVIIQLLVLAILY
jgi:hypothetical protein